MERTHSTAIVTATILCVFILNLWGFISLIGLIQYIAHPLLYSSPCLCQATDVASCSSNQHPNFQHQSLQMVFPTLSQCSSYIFTVCFLLCHCEPNLDDDFKALQSDTLLTLKFVKLSLHFALWQHWPEERDLVRKLHMAWQNFLVLMVFSAALNCIFESGSM